MTPRRRHFITFVVAVLGATFVTTALGAATGASDISRRIAKLAASRVQLDTAPVAIAAPKVTQSADRRAPSAPGAVGVSSASATTITLTWSAARDNVGIAGYGAYLNGARVGTTSTRSYKFTSLACGTTYRLGVDAFDAAHNRSTIAAALAATSPCIDASPPSAPTDLHQTSWSSTGAGVAWTAATDNVGVAGYTVYRDGVPLTTTQGTTSWIGNLVCGSGHSISVETYDAAGNHSPRTTAVVNTTSCADTTAPSVPRNLSVSGSTSSMISVTWEPSSDDRGVVEYRVSLEGLDLRTTTATTASFSGLACGRSYVVKVAAADAAGNVSLGASVSAPTSPCPSTGADTQPPTMPTGLVRRDGTSASVTLSWNPSTDNVGVAGYGIYRAGTKLADANVTAYEVQGLACATSYTFAVDAVDVSGLRSARATLIATTEPCPGTATPSAPTNLASQSRTETSITLSWQASTGASGYRVYRDGVLAGSTSATSYTVSALTCGKSYTLGVEAFNAAGGHSTRPATILSTAACSDVLPPSSPTSLTKSGSTANSISLTWGAAADNVGVAGYSLYLGNTPMGTTAQTSYTFSSLTCGTNYTLSVEAYDAAGNRSARVSASAATSPCATPPPPSGGADTANIWVDANGGTCVDSAVPVAYSDAGACNNLDAANDTCEGGDLVKVKGGTYPIVNITGSNGRSGTRCTIEPGTGEVVEIGIRPTSPSQEADAFQINAGFLTLQGTPSNMLRAHHVIVGTIGRPVAENPTDVSIEYLDSEGFYIYGSTNVAVKHSDFGPSMACYGRDYVGSPPIPESRRCPSSHYWYIPGNTQNYNTKVNKSLQNEHARNIVFEDNVFHDFNIKGGPDDAQPRSLHNGGLFLDGVNGLTLRRNKMYRNVVYDLHVEASCTVSDVLIENNWFGYGVTVQAGSDETSSTNNNFRYQWDLKDNPCGPYKDWLVRYNSFSGPYGIHWALGAGSPTFSNVRVYANIGAGCKSYGSVGLTYKWVAGSETCGEGATLLPEFSVYAASSPTLTSPIDFHLSGSVASDNKVTDTATDFVVSTDIDGDAVTGATRDVGSDQR